ncbi:MAG: ATP synthase F0 subunit B [Deltaproteobacteria bacterium]|nr:ATP synthase F0 subunit B [Deltaproteobacteria bacterium]
MLLSTEVQLMPDKTLFTQLAIFLTVLAALNHFVFKPVLRIIRLRREKTKGDQTRIEELTKQTEGLVKEYEGKIHEARKEAFQMKEAIRREGEAQGQRIIQEARGASLAQMEKASRAIQKETEAASKKLEAQAEGMSRTLAEKLLGRAFQ